MVSLRASYVSPPSRSAATIGPEVARQSGPEVIRSLVPSAYSTSNCASSAGRSPYWWGPNMPTLPAYQPGATYTPKALPPDRSSVVTSYVWYWTRSR